MVQDKLSDFTHLKWGRGKEEAFWSMDLINRGPGSWRLALMIGLS